MTDELEERRVEELADVLGWLLFSPTLTFQIVSSFQTTEMDQFTAYRVFVVVRAWSVACNVPLWWSLCPRLQMSLVGDEA